MDSQNSTDHPDSLLLPYLEDVLSPADRAKVDAHLKECPPCSTALANLKEAVALLKRNKTALCPSPEQLYMLSRDEAVSPEISKHVQSCEKCKEDLRSLTYVTEPMPADLLLKIKQKLPEYSTGKHDSPTRGLLEKLTVFLRPRLVTASALAAAILVLVLVWPTQRGDIEVGLSSVAWQEMMKPKTFLPKMAFVVMHKKDQNIPQSRIDAVYEALQPPMQLSNYYEITSPAALSEAIVNKSIDTSDTKDMLRQFKKYINISETVLITISDQGETSGFEAQKVENSSLRVSASLKKTGIDRRNLNDEIRSAVLTLIAPKN